MILWEASLFVLLTAVGIDLVFGEWPELFHPVVWMGRISKLFDMGSDSRMVRFSLGVFLLGVDVILWGYLAIVLSKLDGIWGFMLQVYMLKSTFSIRSLYVHVSNCATDDIEVLRGAVSCIVSRDVSRLDIPHLVSAAIESLSENVSDSITAPLFFYMLFGLPGAVVYRVVNTLDAMIGYRNERYEWFGKPSARFDDFLNFVPSRLTAVVFSLFSPSKAFSSMKRYARVKVNAAYPMSAFSGVLGVWFEKEGAYRFDGREPTVADIERGLKLYVFSVIIIVGFFCLIVGVMQWSFTVG